MTYKLTAEQDAIITAVTTGADCVIQAGAGTGKTSTLEHAANALSPKRVLYLAFTRANADEATGRMPANVQCRTAHSLAFRAVGWRYKDRLDKAPRLSAKQSARILGINDAAYVDPSNELPPLSPQSLARLALETVKRFCYSADDVPGARHVPRSKGYEDMLVHANVVQAVKPYVVRAWEDLQSVTGKLRYTQDVSIKQWVLTKPRLKFDVIMFDEAQDANPVMVQLVMMQNAQKIVVGDSCQAIYEWRGGVDALRIFDGVQLTLSKSFRFGPAVADVANRFLGLLDADLRITGFDAIDSRVEPLSTSDAVLCRTNAGAISEVAHGTDAGLRVALVGGANDIRKMAEAAADLQAGRGTDHRELMAFQSWGEVQAYVEQEEDGSDLRVFVSLVDKYGPDGVLDICDRLSDEKDADLVVSTAHKAKGLEWDRVRIAGDFPEPRETEDNPDGVPSRADLMLAYVAATRARKVLDLGGLSWVFDWGMQAPVVYAPPESAPVAVAPVVEESGGWKPGARWDDLAARAAALVG